MISLWGSSSCYLLMKIKLFNISKALSDKVGKTTEGTIPEECLRKDSYNKAHREIRKIEA